MRYSRKPSPRPAAARPCLLYSGPVRAVKDHAKGNILIETTADHPEGMGLPVCRLPMGNMAEARAIVAASDLLRAAKPFAALGRVLEGHNPADPLFAHAGVDLAITAGDAQAVRAAHERAISPVDAFRDSAARGHAPRPVNRP